MEAIWMGRNFEGLVSLSTGFVPIPLREYKESVLFYD